jgi:Mg2+/Co2+ transporter CorB
MLTCGSRIKKSLIAFVVAFVLSIGFTILTFAARASLFLLLQSNVAEAQSIDTLLDPSLSLVGLAVFFVVFYFLAKNVKVTAVKSTIISILLGVILGSITENFIILYLLAMVANAEAAAAPVLLSFAAGSSVSSVFQFFLPALTALLFAELREKKLNNSLTA